MTLHIAVWTSTAYICLRCARSVWGRDFENGVYRYSSNDLTTREEKNSPCIIRIFPGEKTPDGPEFSVIVVIGKYPLGKYLLLSRGTVKIISLVPRAYIPCRRRTLVISRSQTFYKRECPSSRCVLLIYVWKFSVGEDERRVAARHLFYRLIKCLLLLLRLPFSFFFFLRPWHKKRTLLTCHRCQKRLEHMRRLRSFSLFQKYWSDSPKRPFCETFRFNDITLWWSARLIINELKVHILKRR